MGELTLVRENHPKASRSGRVSHEHQDGMQGAAKRGRPRSMQSKTKTGVECT